MKPPTDDPKNNEFVMIIFCLYCGYDVPVREQQESDS